MCEKTELKAAAARLLYNSNRSVSDYNMLIDFIDRHFDNQPQYNWVPCSDRLPDEYQKVLVTLNSPSGKQFIRTDQIIKGTWWQYEDEYVIAWQPLPEPYKGE